VEGLDRQEEGTTIKGLSGKYPSWSPAAMIGQTPGSSDKTEDTASLYVEEHKSLMTAADINRGLCPTKEESGVLMFSVCK
jgi:hypothetical protein